MHDGALEGGKEWQPCQGMDGEEEKGGGGVDTEERMEVRASITNRIGHAASRLRHVGRMINHGV